MNNGQSVIGMNAHLSYIKDWGQFHARMQALNPALVVAYIDNLNDAHLITRLQAIIPNTLVVTRLYHPQDGGFHLPRTDGAEWVAAPADTINWLSVLAGNGRVLSLLNEPGTTADVARLSKWINETLKIAAARGIVCCVGNFSTGTPPIIGSQWDMSFDDILRAVADTPHYLGLHEYLPGETYRVGRLAMALKRAATIGVKLPKLLITEYGVDTDGGKESGYHTRDWTGDYYATTLCDVARRNYLPLANAKVLYGAAVFSYGNSGGWEAFDVENDKAFWDTLLRNAPRVSIAPAAVVPPAPPKPAAVPTVNSQAAALVSKMQATLDELKEILAKG